MFDIFKRKKPNTLTSSHQPTLVVDNYAQYASMPKSSSQVDENYAPMPPVNLDTKMDHFLRREERSIGKYIKDRKDKKSSKLKKFFGENPSDKKSKTTTYLINSNDIIQNNTKQWINHLKKEGFINFRYEEPCNLLRLCLEVGRS